MEKMSSMDPVEDRCVVSPHTGPNSQLGLGSDCFRTNFKCIGGGSWLGQCRNEQYGQR